MKKQIVIALVSILTTLSASAGVDISELLNIETADVKGVEMEVLAELDTGLTAYIFTPDGESGESVCFDSCLSTWPAITVSDELVDSLEEPFSVHTREDNGQNQLVLNGRPLYTFAPDQNPGDALGEGVGGVWFVIDAAEVQ